jgi:putative ABC transport system permease protein
MQPYLTSQAGPAMLALMGAAIFLLLIACSNVANLFLVRASLRARDLAVRTAMGASWWRLARQLLAEALLVGCLGSALGFAFAWAGIHDLQAIAPANLPRRGAVAIDLAALAFSISAGIGSALLFALAPSLRAARSDLVQVLRAAGRNGGTGWRYPRAKPRRRLRSCPLLRAHVGADYGKLPRLHATNCLRR